MARPPARDRALPWGSGFIEARPQADGTTRWQARWRDGDRWRARTFRDRDDAEDHVRDVGRAKRDGRYASPVDITVSQLIADWLMRGAGDWSASTYAAYRQRTTVHVLPALGNQRVTALTTPRIQAWIDGMQRAGLAAQTIDGIVRALTGPLNAAVRLGVIGRNPAHGVKRPSIKPTPHATWTAAEVTRVMAVIADEPMWTALYRVALATALRPGELRALRWDDVDLSGGRLIVRRTMTKDREGHVVVGTQTKTGDVAAVALPSPCVRALKTWQTEQKRRRLAASRWHDDGIVFDRGDGRWIALTTWQRQQDAIIAAATVTRITLHELRHTNATLSLDAGVHPLIVSQRLRHKRIQTTLDLYSHVSETLQREATDALARRLFGDEDTTTSDAGEG